MKCIKILAALLLVLCMTFGILACTSSDKVEREVYAYLENKYPKLDFEIQSYTQDNAMSGRYEVCVLCKSSNVVFEVYHSPILTTDSYAVKQANAYMSADLAELLGAAHELAKIESIEWKDAFAEESNGYKFREMSLEAIPYSPLGVTDIHRVTLKDITNANDAAQCVDMVITVLNLKGITLDRVTFAFRIGDDDLLFTTNTETVLGTTYDVLEILFTRVHSNEDEGNLFYRNPDSKTKIIEYIVP